MFKKYNSIENSYRKEFLEKIKGHGFGNETFVVQEKAHGANLSFWTENGIDFRAGKRTAPLEEDERFYNFQAVLANIKPRLQAIWKDLKATRKDLNQLTIFGELIGGSYAHDEVKRSKNAIKVQKGVFYSPENCFYAFDILLNYQEYLDVDVANQLFEGHGLLYAKTLFSGSLADCLAYPNEFNSTIPGLLGLPEIEPNICEGTVIRPAKNLYFGNGLRVMLKNKNEKWAEVAKRSKRNRDQVVIPEKVVELQEAISDYVTENRLNNVLSKIGEVTKSDFGKILGLFNKDVVEDFLKDYQDEFDNLEKKEQKLVTKAINKKAVPLVRETCL